MKKAELIFVPTPGAGHLVSILEFAKRLLDQDDHLLITVLMMKTPSLPFVDSYVKSLTASQSRIQVIDLPELEPPSPEPLVKSVEAYFCEITESYVPHVRNIVTNIISSRSTTKEPVRVAGLVIDFFFVSMIDVANEAGLPSFIFLTSNAGFLSLMMYLPKRHERISSEFKMSDPESLIPGFANPVSPQVLPDALFNEHGGYTAYIKMGRRFKDAKGIIVNTCAELEPYALGYLHGDDQTPPVYPVGPVLSLESLPHPDLDLAQWDKTKKWLDEQPQSSVVFLCFGSGGSFSASQVKEIALGLEQSGEKFLWSMRVSPSSDFKHPEEMLPEGFLERIQGRGMICGWTAQVEVLAHKAIGGFVSHCGWNSILESLWFGVPIVTFPIYGEQQLNAFGMVKELELAVELKLDYRKGSDPVLANEIAQALRSLMQSDSESRKKVKEMEERIRKAVMDGGSSFTSTAQFLKDATSSS